MPFLVLLIGGKFLSYAIVGQALRSYIGLADGVGPSALRLATYRFGIALIVGLPYTLFAGSRADPTVGMSQWPQILRFLLLLIPLRLFEWWLLDLAQLQNYRFSRQKYLAAASGASLLVDLVVIALMDAPGASFSLIC